MRWRGVSAKLYSPTGYTHVHPCIHPAVIRHSTDIQVLEAIPAEKKGNVGAIQAISCTDAELITTLIDKRVQELQQMNVKANVKSVEARELAKKQRRRIKEINKIFADKYDSCYQWSCRQLRMGCNITCQAHGYGCQPTHSTCFFVGASQQRKPAKRCNKRLCQQ